MFFRIQDGSAPTVPSFPLSFIYSFYYLHIVLKSIIRILLLTSTNFSSHSTVLSDKIPLQSHPESRFPCVPTVDFLHPHLVDLSPPSCKVLSFPVHVSGTPSSLESYRLLVALTDTYVSRSPSCRIPVSLHGPGFHPIGTSCRRGACRVLPSRPPTTLV